ncbi:MAG: hypothetical protein AABZ14_08695 [Candidatus Margulisiibacteriota bacterium]
MVDRFIRDAFRASDYQKVHRTSVGIAIPIVRHDPVFASVQKEGQSYPKFQSWEAVPPTAPPNLGKQVTYNIPNGYPFSEIYALIPLSATTLGTYANYVGLLMIKEVHMYSGGKPIFESFDYQTLLRGIMAELPDHLLTTLLDISGGTGFNGIGVVTCPIITPFSRLLYAFNNAPPACPRHLLTKGDLRITLTLASGAELLVAGGTGGGLTGDDITLYLHTIHIPDEVSVAHQSLADSWTLSSIEPKSERFASTNNLQETHNLNNFRGEITRFSFQLLKQSDVATAQNVLFVMQQINKELALKSDGIKIYDTLALTSSSIELIVATQRFLTSSISQQSDTTLARPYIIDYGDGTLSPNLTGVFNTKDIGNLQLVVHQSQATVACYLYVLAFMRMNLSIKNGAFVRHFD